MKRKIIFIIAIILLLLSGTFICWLIYDAFNNDDNIEYANIEKMITENADTAFSFLANNDSEMIDNIKGYIINPEKDMPENTKECAYTVFEKVDAIQPNTVMIKYDKDKLELLVSAAKENELDVILLINENMLNENDITKICKNLSINKICVDLSDNNKHIEKAEKIKEKTNINLGVYLNETLDDKIKTSIENSKLDFYFIQIDSTVETNAENIVKSWSEIALKSQSKIYGILRNDNVTDANSGEIQTVLKYTYNYGGFAGCIMYDRAKLSTDDHQTTTKLYSYYEYFNDVAYTALTLTDFKIKDDKSSVEFSGTTDSNYPTHIWCTATNQWTTIATQGDNGQFTVTVNLIEGKNKIILKHKNAMYTYNIDRAVDVMIDCTANSDGQTVKLTVNAKKDAKVYASIANTYSIELEKKNDNGDYAQFYGEYELTRVMSELTNSQVSFAATYNGITDVVMCNESQAVSPYNDSGNGRSDICIVTTDYAETTSAASNDDTSDPTCTPQLKGSYSYISSYFVCDNHIICVTDTGMKLHLDDLQLIFDGYRLPYNNINLNSVSTENGTTLTFNSLYPSFVRFNVLPQNYYIGYLDRVYNVESFSAEYIDITFSNTVSCSYNSEPDFTASQVFSSAEWYTNAQEKTITLRLYLKEKGSFNGYSYSFDKDGQIVIKFKNNSPTIEGAVIMLDPGHGGYGAPGTSYNLNIYEESITYSIAEKAAKLLSENGAKVIITRNNAQAKTLSERVTLTREKNPDVFVSIHCDGADATSWLGTHTFYYKNYSMPLAASIHTQLVNAYRKYYYTDSESDEYSAVDKGFKFFPYMVTRIEECPGVLVECGYLTNELDATFLASESGQQIIATAIAQGIVDYIEKY